MLIHLFLLAAGLVLLALSSDRFVLGACAIANSLGVTPMVIGMTVVALGTSAPEMVVSATAAIDGVPSMALGSAGGSNIANIALVLGASAIAAPLMVNSITLRREFPMLFLVSALAWVLVLDGNLSRLDASVLSGASIIVLWVIVRTARAAVRADPLKRELESRPPSTMSRRAAVLWISMGLLVMVIGSRMVVVGATGIASAFGVSDLVIGLTVVAVGTSVPELAASLASALRAQPDMAIGNVLGSNMFNLLPVLAIAGFISPFDVETIALRRDFPIMALLTVLLLVMSTGWRGAGCVSRSNGAILLACFAGYQGLLYVMRA